MILVRANESTAARRRVYFHLVDPDDGITPETGEAGEQPMVSSNGGAWTATGIGTLTAIGNGRYYADLTQMLVASEGTIIETRYKSSNTAECPGDSVQVVGFNPHDGYNMGMGAIDASIGSRSTTGEVAAVGGQVTSLSESVSTVDSKVDTLTSRVPDTISLSNIKGQATSALGDYDAPTKAEMDAALASLQLHGDEHWHTATGFAVPDDLADLATTSALNSLVAHGNEYWATPSGFATPAHLAALQDHGDAHWATGSSGGGDGDCPTAEEIADAVWDEYASAHNTTGSMGAKLNSAAAAGDPLASVVPGSYPAGTAGHALGVTLPYILQGVNRINPNRVATSSAVLESGLSIVTVRGDDYTLDSPRGPLDWKPAHDDDWPDLTDATGIFTSRLVSTDAVEVIKPVEFENPAGPGKRIIVQLTADETKDLTPSATPKDHKFDVQITLAGSGGASGKIWTPIRGGDNLTRSGGHTVIEDQTRPG